MHAFHPANGSTANRPKHHHNDQATTAEGFAARPAAAVGAGWSGEDGPKRMYDGHDMSSHEVVVRSLLEVLQEFDEASEGDRTVRKRLGFASAAVALVCSLELYTREICYQGPDRLCCVIV